MGGFRHDAGIQPLQILPLAMDALHVPSLSFILLPCVDHFGFAAAAEASNVSAKGHRQGASLSSVYGSRRHAPLHPCKILGYF